MDSVLVYMKFSAERGERHMKKLSKSKKLLIILPVLFLLIFVSVKEKWLEMSMLWLVGVYDDYSKEKYYKEYPENEATIYLQNTLTDITLVDQIYYESERNWEIYIQADTSEKAEFVLERIPELTAYGKNNFENYDSMDIYCQLDDLCDHFVSCIPYEYKYEVTQNDITLKIEPQSLANEKTVCEIFESGKFPGITTIYSEIELSDKILDNFPDRKKYELYE